MTCLECTSTVLLIAALCSMSLDYLYYQNRKLAWCVQYDLKQCFRITIRIKPKNPCELFIKLNVLLFCSRTLGQLIPNWHPILLLYHLCLKIHFVLFLVSRHLPYSNYKFNMLNIATVDAIFTWGMRWCSPGSNLKLLAGDLLIWCDE